MQKQKQRIAYFDCYSGISGDMVLGALVDLGVKLDSIRKGLQALDLKGFKITSKAVKRGLISGTKVTVTVDKPKKGHHHHGRHFTDIKQLIRQSKLSRQVKTSSIEVFHRIAKAEASVHRSTIEKVHFHEVGAVDSIVDIVGGSIGMELLGVDAVISSPLNLGEGMVECDHGVLPVPAPATLKLLKGLPCFSSGVQKELTTPTGAAMIGYLAHDFGSMPEMTITDSGYGAGDHLIKSSPNMLRIIVGETVGKDSNALMVVESNIDDMNPEFYDHVMESLFKAGAVDVYFTPIQMKKNRPAVKLSVLVAEAKIDEIARLIFSETSTFGLRYFPVDRMTLEREIIIIKTPYGEMKVKIGRIDGKVIQVSPEYEDCKKIARREKIPIKKIYDELLTIAKNFIK
jgi:uncharacterized protein (TIGR00299 family) protein